MAAFLFIIQVPSVPVPLQRNLPVKVRDPKDEQVLATALGGKAEYLLTGDDDLLVLNGDSKLGRLQIVPGGVFLELLQSSEG